MDDNDMQHAEIDLEPTSGVQEKLVPEELLMAFPQCIVLKPAHSASKSKPFWGSRGIEYSKARLIQHSRHN